MNVFQQKKALLAALRKQVYRCSETAYSENRWFPEEPIAFSETGFMRRTRIGRLTINPIRYNPVIRELERLVELNARIDYGPNPLRSREEPDVLERTVISNSLNPQTASEFISQKARKRPTDNVMSKADSWFIFSVKSAGPVKIDRSYISSLGIDPDDIDPAQIRIFDDGWRELDRTVSEEPPDLEEVPLYAIGLDDDRFDSGDALYFYARGPSDWFVNGNVLSYQMHRFTFENVYWLSIGGNFSSTGRRLQPESIQSGDTVTTGMVLHHIEYDQSFAKTGNDIQWGWERTSEKHITFLDSRLDTSNTVIVRHRCVPVDGESVPTTRGTVNGQSPNSWGTSGGAIEARYNDAFTTGTNSIEIPFNGVSVLFDYYEILYRINLAGRNDILTFAGADSGATYVFDGFDAEPVVFDVTDQTDLRMLSVTDLGGGKFAFSDSAGLRRYCVCLLSDAETAPAGSSLVLTDLRDRSYDCDLLMLIPQGLEDEIGEYIAHREAIGTEVDWVFVEDVLTEFGFGVNDPTAIRDFLRYVWYCNDEPPTYILLAGDATWDPRGITDPSPTHCPAALCVANASDDYFYAVTVGDGVPDFAGGRVPINVVGDWREWVAKLKNYEASPDYGPWRIRYVFCADDEHITGGTDGLGHTRQTNTYALSLPSWADNRMIYTIEYPFTSTWLKPLARKDLLKEWNNGSALVNYIGHGNFRLWTHEEVFEATSCVPKLNNNGELPIMFSASCEVGLFYRTTGQCIAEQVILLPDAGAVAAIAATRMTFASSNGQLDNRFIQNCWGIELGERTTAGTALFAAKSGGSYASNVGQYVLFGDPAMIVGPPTLEVVLKTDSDSLLAGQTFHIDGEVHEDGALRTDFNGTVHIIVYDSGYYTTYNSTVIDDAITYYKPGTKLFVGPVEVTNGTFEAEFIVPIDISYGTSGGKIVGYACSDVEEGVGFMDSLIVYGDTSIVISDSICPEIAISLEGAGFSEGGVLCGDGTLVCELSDESGINITGSPGHGINLTLDGDEAGAVDLSPYFSYNLNSHNTGVAEYELTELSPGTHSVVVKAWDNMGNGCDNELIFEVSDCDIAISNPLAYPNPFQDGTDITFNIDESAEVTVKVFTLSGRLVRELTSSVVPAFAMVHWDGCDRHGEPVANGAYIAKIEVRAGNGRTDNALLKIAKTR